MARSAVDQARGQLGALTTMFLLGMGVNLIGVPSETTGTAKIVSTILLTLHGLVGIGLVVGAVITFLAANKLGSGPSRLARAGGMTIVLTFIFGLVTLATDNGWWSFLMAAGFIASFWIYGILFIRLKKQKSE